MSSSPLTTGRSDSEIVQLPEPTAWPIVLAFGIALIFAGLVTDVSVSVLGAVLAIAGSVGWFRNVLPHEAHESVPVVPEQAAIATTRRDVARLEIASQPKRAWLHWRSIRCRQGLKEGWQEAWSWRHWPCSTASSAEMV